ncbi:MAG: hypothetical protein KVP17_003591 [Porospora cf. gigantea B]|uniref:uncharacterized protein n=1 Tax=Porospora cf. gigantea B TaxID=2853592 RepID=UPI0035717EA6|nr:MAG: hypothetical protein KVP17_003591 [Porospora cf. gigantea B]
MDEGKKRTLQAATDINSKRQRLQSLLSTVKKNSQEVLSWEQAEKRLLVDSSLRVGDSIRVRWNVLPVRSDTEESDTDGAGEEGQGSPSPTTVTRGPTITVEGVHTSNEGVDEQADLRITVDDSDEEEVWWPAVVDYHPATCLVDPQSGCISSQPCRPEEAPSTTPLFCLHYEAFGTFSAETCPVTFNSNRSLVHEGSGMLSYHCDRVHGPFQAVVVADLEVALDVILEDVIALCCGSTFDALGANESAVGAFTSIFKVSQWSSMYSVILPGEDKERKTYIVRGGH